MSGPAAEGFEAFLDEFLRAAVHDIRGPVNQLRALAGMLAEQHGETLGEDGAQLCEYIEMAAARAAAVVDAIQAYVNVPGSPSREVVDMNAVFSAAQAGLEDKIVRRRAMIRSGELGCVSGDQRMLTAVWRELLDNAIKFNHSEPPEIQITARQQPGAIEYSIFDNGIGIPPERGEVVFKPLKRLNGFEYEGAGMGLAITRRIIEAHGGSIHVETKDSTGAEIRFMLPRARC